MAPNSLWSGVLTFKHLWFPPRHLVLKGLIVSVTKKKFLDWSGVIPDMNCDLKNDSTLLYP